MHIPIIPVPAAVQPGPQTAQWILDQITTYPETYDQSRWRPKTYCGTTYCVAGWAAFLQPQKLDELWPENQHETAAEAIAHILTGMHTLGIDEYTARYLFDASRKADEVMSALKELANGDPVTIPDYVEEGIHLQATIAELQRWH